MKRETTSKIPSIEALTTPVLLLNKSVLKQNCSDMQNKISSQEIALRPHMKTAKCIEVYRMATENGFKGITVSTLAEASYFAENGVCDILYAVGVVPEKLDQVAQIQSAGCDLKVITDNVQIISALNDKANQLNITLNLAIEIDCGGLRGGVDAGSGEVIELGGLIQSSENINFIGVMTHAGQSYHSRSIDEIVVIAEQERVSVIRAANRLSDHLGLDSKMISAGSTPTATYAKSSEGLTEMRPGVYMFGDVDQYFIGSCTVKQIAASVLSSVIGHNKKANRILIDAGGLALSKDCSASEFSQRTGYGWICDVDGNLIEGLYIDSVHQEHGLISCVSEMQLPYDSLPVGSKVRVLPIHACMTVAAFDHYHVHNHGGRILSQWQRVNRW